MRKKAIIIGAGPAGLTAAYELLKRTDIIPIILERSGDIGGISKTVNYKGNRMDIGGHRFFSKSDRVMAWWLNILPIQSMGEKKVTVTYQGHHKTIEAEEIFAKLTGKEQPDKIMLVRKRLSRIYFLRKFFTYPVQLSLDTLKKLGLARTIGIMASYLKARLFPHKPEKSLEDFFINRFGDNLYRLFFKDYTEKVWGVPCTKISAEWGAQRIKGISVARAIAHAVKSMKSKGRNPKGDIGQKGTETSLIENFLYPKFGPGQLWEEVARLVQEMGGHIHRYQQVQQIDCFANKLIGVHTENSLTGDTDFWTGHYFFSTMPVQELIASMNGSVPANVQEVAAGLQYRDFVTVGLLLSRLATEKMLPDTWIYIQERDVKAGRLQIFNNWSPYMVKDPDTVWIGLEYFCDKADEFWNQPDETIQAMAIREVEKIGLAKVENVLDSKVLRMEKAYPAYFGTYDRFEEIREFTDRFGNLFLVGRNGMHKYNNSDHSMLTAMVAVDNIIAGTTSKANLWAVNTENEYHEEKTKTAEAVVSDPMPERPAKPARERACAPEPPFGDYIWRNGANRTCLLFALVVFLTEFILFKFRYPYANYMPDSYSYLEAAATNTDVSMWPVAYSKFLRLISVFTHSDKIVVAIQYFFMQAASLTFLFTLFHFLKPGLIVRNGLLIFFFFDPAILYMSNYISADSLFIGLSFLWLTSLLWIIYQPKAAYIMVHGILLLACFTVRYNAIYYPFIGALAFLISRYRWYWKLSGIGLTVLLVLYSVLVTSYKMKDLTGQWQFSAFGGWQLANNALYMYETIPAKDRTPVPARFQKLETMVRQHMDTLSKVKLTADETVSAHFYLWSGKGPLIQYMANQYRQDSTTPYFKRWSSIGPMYSDYGKYLIEKYPIAFAKAWLIPNAIRYALPPPEFLSIYNMGKDSVGLLAKQWFNYKTLKIGKKSKETNWLQYFPSLSSISNIIFIGAILGFWIVGGFKKTPRKMLSVSLLFLAFWLTNFLFSVFASPIVLRYELVNTLVAITIGVVLAERIMKMDEITVRQGT